MPGNHPTPMLRGFALLGVVAFTALWIASPELFPGNSKLYDAIDDGDESRARQLLEAGADPNSRSYGMATHRHVSKRYQFPPLLFAIWRNEPRIALLLLEAGADPNARDRDGDTPLIAAADAGMTEVVRALIEKGADVHAASRRDGSTPLHFGPATWVGAAPAPKEFLAPEIRAMLERAGAR